MNAEDKQKFVAELREQERARCIAFYESFFYDWYIGYLYDCADAGECDG